MSYDDWAVSGSWHKCACGGSWSDSDGSPCHETCNGCGAVVAMDDLNDDGYCEDCAHVPCDSCGEYTSPEEYGELQGLCPECDTQVKEIQAKPFEDLPLVDPAECCPAALEVLRKRLSTADGMSPEAAAKPTTLATAKEETNVG